MVDIPTKNAVKSSVLTDAKDGFVGGISAGIGRVLAGDVGDVLGGAVGGAMIGGRNGSAFTVSNTGQVTKRFVAGQV